MSRRNALIGAGIALFGILAGVAYHLYSRPPQLDAPILKVIANVSSIDSYVQHVDTEVVFPDRTLTIVGTYLNDFAAERFASLSTTTLAIPDQPVELREHTFTHENIAIGNDVFLRVDTESDLLKQTGTITYGPDWHHFTDRVIPEGFTDIAVPGPIHDSLVLLSENGTFLTLTEKHGKVMWGSEEFRRYTFIPSGLPAPADSSLKALLERIGPGGTIDVWIDERTSTVRYLVTANDEYRSTTTVSGINTPLTVEPPLK